MKQDFAISAPRIAVLSLNPHAGDGGLLGTEEQEIIIPAINEMAAKGMLCYGPYPADGLWAQITLPILMVSWPCITTRAGTVQGIGYGRGRELYCRLAGDTHFACSCTAYDIAGKGIASEDSFRQAIYVAIDVFRNRQREKEAHANPLRKQYYEKRDDSDKLKLDSVEEDL